MRPPNVVILLTGQQRHDTIGLHGNSMRLTPALDRVVLKGTYCLYGFTLQPLCTLGHACLLTGQWQTHTGVFHNRTALRRETALPRATLASGTWRASWWSGPSSEAATTAGWRATHPMAAPMPIGQRSTTAIECRHSCLGTGSTPRPTRPFATSTRTSASHSSRLWDSSSLTGRTAPTMPPNAPVGPAQRVTP